jgi:hypothetical protein
LGFGTKRENNHASTAFYNNVADLVGMGLTYKWIDFDVAFSLPKTRLQDVGLQNLTQFRLAGSYTSRKFMIRGYYLNSSGIIIEDEGGQFKSSPDVNMLHMGIQYTYCFNFHRYSLQAAAVHYELQRKSAGSFLIRGEPFYRRIGIGTVLVPGTLDTPELYGQQAGLRYAYSPGLLILPGYGYTWAIRGGKYFIAPMIFLGTGFSVSTYKGNQGEHSTINTEWSGVGSLNLGYNGSRMYVALRSSYEIRYFLLDPSYFTFTDLKANITVGYRFMDWEKLIPKSIF